MTPDQIVHFVRGAPATIRLVYPDVGWKRSAYPVFGAEADGPRMCFVGAGEPYTLFGAYVISATRVGDQVVIQTKKHPAKQIVLSRVHPGTQAAADYKTALDEFDEVSDGVVDHMKDVLQTVAEPGAAGSHKFDYVRWGHYNGDEIEPIGIITRSADGTKLTAVPFPGHERAANRWIAFESIGPDVLNELPEIAGQETFISGPMTVVAEDWDDASNIALFEFGAEYYARTGRSVFA